MDVLNYYPTGMHTILALIVNFKWNACKNERSRENKLLSLTCCHYTEIVQRIFKCGDIQHTRLTPDKELNSLIYKQFSMSTYTGVTNI